MESQLLHRMNEIAAVLVKTPGKPGDLNSILQHIAQTAQDAFATYACVILAFNPITSSFISSQIVGNLHVENEQLHDIPSEEGVTQEVLRDGIILIENLETQLKYHNRFLHKEGCSTYTCPTHRDFNQHNLLVDTASHTWLIDFQATGPGHILRDVAQLDSEIRFLLLAPEEATLRERLSLEKALCSIKRFSQVQQLLEEGYSTTNEALAKAYATVVHLRLLAHTLVKQKPDDDMSEYYIALLYHALNTLQFFSLSQEQREHALLCASLLADQLGLSS